MKWKNMYTQKTFFTYTVYLYVSLWHEYVIASLLILLDVVIHSWPYQPWNNIEWVSWTLSLVLDLLSFA